MNEKEYPTKKGACLTPGRLSVLRSRVEQINAVLKQQEVNASYGVELGGGLLYKLHLGAGIYLSVSEKFNGVNIRRYWIPEGQDTPIPTKNGIYLPMGQWKALVAKIDQLVNAHPELVVSQPCVFSHENQIGFIDCAECSPFGWIS